MKNTIRFLVDNELHIENRIHCYDSSRGMKASLIIFLRLRLFKRELVLVIKLNSLQEYTTTFLLFSIFFMTLTIGLFAGWVA